MALKPYKGPNKVTGAFHQAQRGVKNTAFNRVSQKADRMGDTNEMGLRHGSWKFGEKGVVGVPVHLKRNLLGSAALGAAGGSLVGEAAGAAQYNKNTVKHQKQAKQINAENRRLKQGVAKARPHLITDVGTAAERVVRTTQKQETKRYPGFVPTVFGAGAAGLGAAGYNSHRVANKAAKKSVTRAQMRNTKLTNQVQKSRMSAFGVDHGA